MGDFEDYKQEVTEDIEDTVTAANCQPVIFAGTGLSMRYFGAPGWDELLEMFVEQCDLLEEEYGFYRQTKNPPAIGQFLAKKYAEWAWSGYSKHDSENKSNLNWEEELFDHKNPQDVFLKSEIATHLREITPNSVDELNEDRVEGVSPKKARQEIELLQEIQPHAVITTNYDRFFEAIFNEQITDDNLLKGSEEDSGFQDKESLEDDIPSYRVVVGEQVLRTRYRNIGEILHIHGSVSDPRSLVLTEDDYREFNNQRRYLSSKMLTYFAEHPLLIVGYQPNDPNVQQVLSWAVEILSEGQSITNDIFFLQYDENAEERDEYPLEYRIRLDEGDSLRVKNIVASDFEWVFKAFAERGELEVDPKYLRSLLARTYDVVTSLTPETEVVDVKQLEDAAADKEELGTILGIFPAEEVPPIEFDHTIRPSEAAEKIGLDGYNILNNEVIDKIEEETEIDIKSFNNRYHIALTGGSKPRRYSEEAIELFRKVNKGEEYELNIPEQRIPD